jgi:hypothetical protein
LFFAFVLAFGMGVVVSSPHAPFPFSSQARHVRGGIGTAAGGFAEHQCGATRTRLCRFHENDSSCCKATNHRDDTNFLNLFNEQHITENRRHQITWDALSGRTAARKGNKAKLIVRDDMKLESMVQSNITLQSRHERRLKEYWKLKSRPRTLTYQALCAKFIEHNDETGKEHPCAEKLDIAQKQTQLRKQRDRMTKV